MIQKEEKRKGFCKTLWLSARGLACMLAAADRVGGIWCTVLRFGY